MPVAASRLARRTTFAFAASFLALASLAACSGGDAAGTPTDATSSEVASDDGGGTSLFETGGDAGGPMCEAQGTFCGGHGMSGGDPGTLYTCAGSGFAPASSSTCTNGCSQKSSSSAECTVAAPDAGSPGPTCPGGGLFCGSDGVTGGAANTLYTCPGKGLSPTSSQPCANGCQVEPAGTNDLCKGAIVCPTGGDYCGGDSMSGDPNTLYHCAAGGQAPSSSQPCANGCVVKPAGTNDVCRTTLSCPGAGDYCGGDGVQGGATNTLYHCPGAGQAPSGSQACASGCTIMPAGTPDYCASTMSCPTSGDYCGNDKLGGPANVLYHCTAAGQPPASSTVCASGCLIEPQGTNDVCAAGSGACSATDQAALNWEANQLNTGHSWSDYCLAFVYNAYVNAGRTLSYLQAPDANTALNQAKATGHFVPWNGSCPCGAILFWSANSCNGEWGHVVICNGDGTVSTSGWPGFAGSTHATITWLDGQECGNTPSGYILP